MMLLLLGSRSYHSHSGTIDRFNCPKCKTESELSYAIHGRYAHITLIPLFPVDKEMVVFCHHCNEVIESQLLSEDQKNKIEHVKKSASFKAPVWTYSGSVIALIAVIFGVGAYLDTKDNSKIYLEKPMIGDVYNVKKSNGYYTTYRIDKITNDSIFVTTNDLDAYLPYETDDIDTPENYTNQLAKYSKQQIQKLYENDEIYAITRK